MDEFWTLCEETDEVVTDSTDVEVSGGDVPIGFTPGKFPDVGLVPVSDPFAEAAELGTPPALAEFKEYIEEVDVRFPSDSPVRLRGSKAASGNEGCLESSAIVPAASFGVSKSSMTDSGRGLPVPPDQISEFSDGLR